MPLFKIYRLKDSQYQQFRWAPHTAGASQVKARDYIEGGEIEAPTLYTAWTALRDAGRPLRVGDLLEDAGGVLRICKYVGLEEAQWFVPEVKTAPDQAVPGTPENAACVPDAPKS